MIHIYICEIISTSDNKMKSTENKEEKDSAKVETNSKMCNLLFALKNLFLAEHLAGIYRFSINGGKLLPPTWVNKLYGLLLLVLYLVMYAIFLHLPTIIDGSSSLVDVIDEIPCIVILIQYVITLITTNILFNKTNKEIFTMFADLDDQLITTNSDEFYKRARAKTNKFILLLALSHAIISVTDLAAEEEIDTSEVIFLPLYLIQKLEMVVFCLLIEMLKSRLDIINGYIMKFLEEKDGESDRISVFTVCEGKEVIKQPFNMIGHPSENNMKIRDLAAMYDTIGCICSMINNVFNFQIFMTLLSTFTYIIITIWTSLYYYRTPENNSGPLITIIIWCITTLMTVATLCFVCERLRLTRNASKILVNQIIMDYNLPKIMRVQAKAFMELIEAWPLHILIYDMFSVDITLMLKFISVSTTYLIVIIQVSHFN